MDMVFYCSIFFVWLNAADEEVKIYSSLSDVTKDTSEFVLLIFFSTECSICWEDLFEMKYFVKKNDLPVQVIGISKDSKKTLERFLEKYSYYEPVISDTQGKLYRKYDVDLEPYKIILKDNTIFYKDYYYEDFFIRRKKAKECLLKIASK